MQIDHLDHLVLTVADVDATLDFYTRVLGMQLVTFGEARKALAFASRRSTCTRPGASSSQRPNGLRQARQTCALSSPRHWTR